MRKAESERFLKKLRGLSARMVGEVTHLTDEAFTPGGGSTQPNHMAELGSATYEQDVTLQMLECEGDVLEEIRDAIERIRLGSFGKCERCRKQIPRPRLNAIPYTRYCVQCARDVELEG